MVGAYVPINVVGYTIISATTRKKTIKEVGHMLKWKHAACAASLTVLSCGVAQAIEINTMDDSVFNAAFDPANVTGSGAGILADTLITDKDNITLIDATLSGHIEGTAQSAGTFTNELGTYSIAEGIILSNGNIHDYGYKAIGSEHLSNTTVYGDHGLLGIEGTQPQQDLLNELFSPSDETWSFQDVTQFDLEIEVGDNVDRIYFTVAFASEDHNEAKDGDFKFPDPFAIMLNGENIAYFDGQIINAKHDDMGDMPVEETEADGFITPNKDVFNIPPLMLFEAVVAPGQLNTLSFIIADTNDGTSDSLTYINSLTTINPLCSDETKVSAGTAGGGIHDILECDSGDTGGQNGEVPAPATLALLGLGLLGMRIRSRKH